MITEKSLTPEQLLTFTIAGQLLGVPVLQVNDVLKSQKITFTPLAPSAIAGIMNLRGRIVTAVDVRTCLHQKQKSSLQESMNVVVDYEGELFSLIIDEVGDVLNLTPETYEEVPMTLDPVWRSVADGIHKLSGEILVVLDVKKLLEIAENEKVALQ